MPSIKAQISTSSPVLDLESESDFIITIDLFLDNNHDITFPRRDVPIFKGAILRKGGLTFTDTATGIDAGRNTICICGPDHGGAFRKDNQDSFLTLCAGQKHTITVVIERMLRKFGPLQLPPNSTVDDYIEAKEKLPEVWKWRHTENLDNGKTYRIGIDQESTIKRWFEGSKEELLSRFLYRRTDDKMSKEPILFLVTQPATFTVKRPDTDGSLNWP